MAIMLEIREQPRLPLHKQVEICADGIQHRLFRAVLTLAIVILAIAFLMNVLGESMIARACKEQVFAQALQQRQLIRLEALFQHPVTVEQLRRRLADAQPDSWQAQTLAAWLHLSRDEVRQLQQRSAAGESYLVWLQQLPMGQRRLLLGNRDDEQALHWLATPQGAEEFAAALAQIPTLKMPEGLTDFAADYPQRQAVLQEMATTLSAQLARLQPQLHGGSLTAWFTGLDDQPEQAAALQAFLAAQGLHLSAGQFQELQQSARHAQRVRRLYELLATPGLATQWRNRYSEVFELDTALERLAHDPARITWLLEQAPPDTLALDAAALASTISRLTTERAVTDTEARLIANYGQQSGLGTRVFWLIVVSMLVCSVGIANAMLMSVLERFREIATMKCLGALDGFIAVLFLLEAAFLGLVGAAIGVVAGLLLGLGRMAWSYGGWVWQSLPWLDLLEAAGVGLLTGVTLATLAAIYPAWRASRMPPMEAMRVE